MGKSLLTTMMIFCFAAAAYGGEVRAAENDIPPWMNPDEDCLCDLTGLPSGQDYEIEIVSDACSNRQCGECEVTVHFTGHGPDCCDNLANMGGGIGSCQPGPNYSIWVVCDFSYDETVPCADMAVD